MTQIRAKQKMLPACRTDLRRLKAFLARGLYNQNVKHQTPVDVFPFAQSVSAWGVVRSLFRKCDHSSTNSTRPPHSNWMSSGSFPSLGTQARAALNMHRVMSSGSGRPPRALPPSIRNFQSRAVEETVLGGTVLTASPALPARLDRFLAESRPGVPFSFVQKLIRMRKVRIQGSDGVWLREKNSARRLEAGELVRVHSQLFAEGTSPANGGAHMPYMPVLPTRDIQRVRKSILFEDEDCIVINKVCAVCAKSSWPSFTL